MSEILPTHVTDDYDVLRPGSIELWVPVEGDVVQLGALEKPNHRPLDVTIGIGEVTIRRADGTLLQVESHEVRSGEPAKVQVFERPIDELRLWRLEENLGRWAWQAGSEEASVSEVELLHRFVGLVGSFCWTKQQDKSATKRKWVGPEA